MSVSGVFRIAAAVAVFAATPALAGPAGSGRAVTEEVAKKRAVVKVAQGDAPCVQQAAAALQADGQVRAVKVSGDALHVTFRSAKADREWAQQEVAKVCGADAVVAGS